MGPFDQNIFSPPKQRVLREEKTHPQKLLLEKKKIQNPSL
jgi:hypothetical protein